MAGALEGVKVLEFSEMIAAPFAGMLLADLGADVLKVEPPDGESWRRSNQFRPGESRVFMAVNRNKRGMVLDLHRPEAQEIAQRLAALSDVVLVNYRPDTPARLGIDWPTLSALNPGLVYVSNTALGSEGPDAHRPGYDLIAQAMTGLMATAGKVDERGIPQPIAPAVADFATGLAMAGAACAALVARARTGRGQRVECSLLATALAFQGSAVMEIPAAADQLPERLRQARRAGASPEELQRLSAGVRDELPANIYYRCYRTRDSVIAVACLTPTLRRRFTGAVGLADPRMENRELPRTGPEGRALAAAFGAQVEERMNEKSTEEWLAIFDQAGVPAGPFRAAWELIDDEQVAANGMVAELDHPVAGPVRMLGPIVQMSDTPTSAGSPSPTLGQNTTAVLTDLGYTDAEIEKLRETGAVG